MKYMHFLSSCSYAGLANLLEDVGIDTEDVSIALSICLPWLLGREEDKGKIGKYSAGAMLQGKEWFDLYLKPLGWRFAETMYEKREALRCLVPGSMLGMRVLKQSKHAVIYRGRLGLKYVFLNNRREDGSEPNQIILSEEELLEKLDDTVCVGRLETGSREKVNFIPLLEQSKKNWELWLCEFQGLAALRQEREVLGSLQNTFFRAFLLDGLAVCGLFTAEVGRGYEGKGRENFPEEETLFKQQKERLICLQNQFLEAMRRGEALVLEREMDMELVQYTIHIFLELIDKKLKIMAG